MVFKSPVFKKCETQAFDTSVVLVEQYYMVHIAWSILKLFNMLLRGVFLVQKVFEGGFIMCWHMHAHLNFSAFSIEEFFGSKPVNDVKMH